MGRVGSTFRIHVLVRPGCTAFVPLGVADMFRKVASLGQGARSVEVLLVSTETERTVECAGRFRVGCDLTIAEAKGANLVFVPPVDPGPAEKADVRAERYLRRVARSGALIASACTGTFFVARAGLLDGLTATTHWAFHGLFAAQFPQIKLDPHAIIVDQGQIVTAAGATAFVPSSPISSNASSVKRPRGLRVTSS